MKEPRIGVWIIGALGDVATTAIVGAKAIHRGLASTTGLVSETEEIRRLPMISFEQMVFGGHDIRQGTPLKSARELERELKCFGQDRVDALSSELASIGKRIRPGLARGRSHMVDSFLLKDLGNSVESVSDGVDRIRQDLAEFKESEGIERVVVVHLTSTEPKSSWKEAYDSWSALQAAIEANDTEVPASVLYAVAAFQESCDFINFTPCLGSSIPALHELAHERGVCHAGRDGKTGETLVRTMLAPMFLARNLRVLSWSGFNVLGNRDGQILSDPYANQAKTSGKDAVLRSILGNLLDDSLTRIDYVPSLKDWKTAWDLIHFEGFLGTKMTLQFTWQGADSALAAPLILDLVRLINAAREAGRAGIIGELACFFKDPMGWKENSFPKQVARLEDFAKDLTPILESKRERERVSS